MGIRTFWTILVTAAAVAGCADSGTGLPYEEDAYPPGYGDTLGDVPPPGCLSQSVWAKPDFDWRMTQDVTMEIVVVHLDGEPWPDVVVSVYDDASDLPGLQNLIAEGLTDDAGHWISTAVLPSDQSAVNVVVNIMGAKNWDRIPVADGRVSAEFGRGE